MADEKLQIDITAKDDASKVIDPLVKKVDQLEKSDPTVEVDADTKSATNDVDSFAKKLDKLSSSDQVVLLALRAGAAQTELADIATQLATIDASDPDVDVKLSRYQEVSGQLDDLQGKIKAIGDADPDVGANLDVAKHKLDGITESSGRAKDAVHGMAGGVIGDMASTATGIGPVGEALGQLAEQAQAGESSIRELASAGATMGVLAAAVYVLQGAMQSIAETKAFHTAEVDAYTKSIKAGSDATQDLADRLTDTGKIMAAPSFTNLSNWIGLSDAVRDVTKTVTQAGLTVDTYTQLVTGVSGAIGEWANAQVAAGVDAKTVADAVDVLFKAHKDYETAVKASTESAKFFTQTEQAVTAAADDYVNTLADVAANTRNTSGDTRVLINALRDAKTGVHDLDAGYQALQGTIDHDQSMINLKNKIDDVRQAGDDALAAQVAANEALASGAKDAGAKQDEATTKMRAFQTATNDLKSDIIRLGQTAGENPVDVKADLDKIDQGDLDAVAADAEAYYRRNPIDAATRLKLISTIVAGVGQPVTITGGSVQSAPGVVNNFLARPAAAREIARTQSRHARINGR